MKDEKRPIGDSVTEIGVNQLDFNDPRLFGDLLGQHDQHIKILQNTLGVKIRVRGASIEVEGDPLPVELASQILHQLYSLLEKGYPVYASDVDYAIRILSGDSRARLQDIFLDTIYISAHKRTITPKSIAQKAYIDAIRRYDIVFGIGPAGTGKTYLAMAMAVAELMKNNYVRIILTRPAVEAGEKLGFLPGDLAEKVNPYLRPLYDALHDMVDFDRARKMVERFVCDSRRSAKHHSRANENVSDPARLRLEGGDHGRRNPNRSTGRKALGPKGSMANLERRAWHSLCDFYRERRSPPSPGAGDHQGL